MTEAWMIMKWDDDEDATVDEITFEEAKVCIAQAVSLGFTWRPIAHGVRIVGAVDPDRGEVAYTDFVDTLAFEDEMARRGGRGDFRA